jgi:hypothetical protein
MSLVSVGELDIPAFIAVPVEEPTGEIREYIGIHVPESIESDKKERLQEFLGSVSVKDLDPTTPPKVRNEWVVRPAALPVEKVLDAVQEEFPDIQVEVEEAPIKKMLLARMIGRFAVTPPPKPQVDRNDYVAPDKRWQQAKGQDERRVVHTRYGETLVIGL